MGRRERELRSVRGAIAVALALLVAGVVAGPAAAGHVTRTPGQNPGDVNPKDLPVLGGNPVPERLAYDDAESCTGGAQPGTVKLQEYLEFWFRGHEDGIYNCPEGREPGIHGEGRALNWALRASDDKDAGAARRIRRFFLNEDRSGERWAMARRFGIQRIVWNDHEWRATPGGPQKGWHPCPCGHTDHMHIEQRWKGALMKTSAYTGYETTHGGPRT